MIKWLLTFALVGTAVLPAAQGLPMDGKADSPVRVIIYEDLQCSDCADFRIMLDQKLLPKYADRVAFIHRDFPLARHLWARPAAIASRHFASVDPKLSTEFRQHVMANQRDITAENFQEKLVAFAKAKGQDSAKVLAALGNPGYAAAVELDFQDGVARGVSKTPTAYVNAKAYIETFTFEEISKGIDQALAEAK